MNKISRKYRKFRFYLLNSLQFALIPRWCFRRRLNDKLSCLTSDNRAKIMDRVNYYNKLSKPFDPGKDAVRCGSLRPGKKNTYVFDLHRTLRHFNPDLKISYLFGDVTQVPAMPRIVKSRPIHGDNHNSILMKLNQIRHFYFVPRDKPFDAKKNKVVWRGKRGKKRSRIKLIQHCDSMSVCDIGYTDKKSRNDPNYQGFMSIKQQLDFKFILSVEGNDVATNLKWIMSSNSLCLMTKPKYETWFMEGRLLPNWHYVLLRDDYADLEEKVDYYVKHPKEALQIIKNAHNYIEPFKNQQQEELIQLLVLEKYFQLSGQIQTAPDLD